MSLYYEAAAALNAPASDGGNLKTRIFGPRSRDSTAAGQKGKAGKEDKDKDADATPKRSAIPPAQIYALAAEACKWSAVLAEVIDRAGLLVHARVYTLAERLGLPALKSLAHSKIHRTTATAKGELAYARFVYKESNPEDSTIRKPVAAFWATTAGW